MHILIPNYNTSDYFINFYLMSAATDSSSNPVKQENQQLLS